MTFLLCDPDSGASTSLTPRINGMSILTHKHKTLGSSRVPRMVVEYGSTVVSYRGETLRYIYIYYIIAVQVLHQNRGQKRTILAKAALVRNYLEEVYEPCAGGLSAVNVIGTQLRDPINWTDPMAYGGFR